MKTQFLAVLSFGLTAHASASAPAAPNVFKNFKSTARFAKEAFANSECFMNLQEDKSGLKISLQDDNQETGYFVASSGKITLSKGGQESPDESFDRTFVIDGIGSLHVVHADDAFDTVEIWSGNKHLECELNY